jgi:hypothetical protein
VDQPEFAEKQGIHSAGAEDDVDAVDPERRVDITPPALSQPRTGRRQRR